MSEILMPKEMHSVEFYVTKECNGCGLCKSIAPDFFEFVEYAYTYFVSRQPKTESDVDLLREVSDICTVDAIREITKSNG